jgi:hypothetical protein
MKYQFAFPTSAQAQDYCDRIVDEMVSLFGITAAEALGRINEKWGGLAFSSDDTLFHETIDFWAYDIYFGHNSRWWEGTQGLKPVEYPRSSKAP